MSKLTGWFAATGITLAALWGGSVSAVPPATGTISIEARDADAAFGPSMPAFVNALSEAFATRGFTVIEQPGHAAYVVELDVSRVDVGTGTAKVPTDRSTVEPGGAPNAVGVGVRIPLATGKSTLVPLQRTRMEVRIKTRADQGLVWHGTAITVRAAGTRKGQDAVVAADLSAALLRAYPAQPEDVIGVP